MLKLILKIDPDREKEKFITYVLNNRLEYEFFQKNKKKIHIRKKVLLKYSSQEETILEFNKLLNKYKFEFFFFKTFKKYKYIFSDVDVFIKKKDLKKIIELLNLNDYEIAYYKPKDQYTVIKNNLCFDIHTHFNRNRMEISMNNPPNIIKYNNIIILNENDDYFLNVLNILLEKFHINYIDFSYLNEIHLRYGELLSKNFKKNNFYYLYEIFNEEIQKIKKKDDIPPKIISYKNFLKIIILTLVIHKKILLFEVFYFHFALFRYYITNKKYLPVFKRSWLKIK